ncbi:MAG: AAA family ATPase [Candidatus Nanopelagicales bacterium]
MDVSMLIESLGRAVEREQGDPVLRLHLAQVLVSAGRGAEAVAHLGVLLAADPGNAEYQQSMRAAMGEAGAGVAGAPAAPADVTPARGAPAELAAGGGAPADGPAPGPGGFDWGAAEADLVGGLTHEPVETRLHLADVGGLQAVKERIESAFLTPLRNPELRARYGKSLRGGLLLYGPPGCGKTYLARAVAGELGARFITTSLADVLSKWVGGSEANVAELFRYARSQAPCVLFFDEVDALGRSRAGLGRAGSALRGVVNQILSELDGIGSDNEGLFVLGATNAPWDIDAALRRPGRFDRSAFVEPPDHAAREQILRTHLAGLPVDPGLDLAELTRRTPRFSGADLAHACQAAAELALVDAARTGSADRLITQGDLLAAIGGITPSTGRWFESARNVVLFADAVGEYAPLADYMRANKLL